MRSPIPVYIFTIAILLLLRPTAAGLSATPHQPIVNPFPFLPFRRHLFTRQSQSTPNTTNGTNVTVYMTCIDTVWTSVAYNLSEYPALDSFTRFMAAFFVAQASGYPDILPLTLQEANFTNGNFSNKTLYAEVATIAGDVVSRIVDHCIVRNETNATESVSVMSPAGASQGSSPPNQGAGGTSQSSGRVVSWRPFLRRVDKPRLLERLVLISPISRQETENNARVVFDPTQQIGQVGEIAENQPQPEPPQQQPLLPPVEEHPPGPCDTPPTSSSEPLPESDDLFNTATQQAYERLKARHNGELPPEATDLGMEMGAGVATGIISNIVGGILNKAAVAPLYELEGPAAGSTAEVLTGQVFGTTGNLIDMVATQKASWSICDCEKQFDLSHCDYIADSGQRSDCQRFMDTQLRDCQDIAVVASYANGPRRQTYNEINVWQSQGPVVNDKGFARREKSRGRSSKTAEIKVVSAAQGRGLGQDWRFDEVGLGRVQGGFVK